MLPVLRTCLILLVSGVLYKGSATLVDRHSTGSSVSYFVARRAVIRKQPSPFASPIAELRSKERVVAAASSTLVNEHGTWLQVQATKQQLPMQGRGSRRAPIWGWIPMHDLWSADRHREALYTANYGRLATQREMVLDVSRTQAYIRAIDAHSHLFAQAVVLDVGCGSGILSLFAARAGAHTVLCVEKSPTAAVLARSVVATNTPFASTIEVIVADLDNETDCTAFARMLLRRNLTVTVLISEWMGYLGVVEGMLSTVILARDRFLSPSGTLFPDQFTLHLAGASSAALPRHATAVRTNARLEMLATQYGVDLTPLRDDVKRDRERNEPQLSGESMPIYITAVDPADVCTTSAVVIDWDLAAATVHEILNTTTMRSSNQRARLNTLRVNFTLRTTRSECTCGALVLWWSVLFRGQPRTRRHREDAQPTGRTRVGRTRKLERNKSRKPQTAKRGSVLKYQGSGGGIARLDVRVYERPVLHTSSIFST